MATEKKPNFLVIVADDLGFSDIGCYGSEIRTPNLDRLASAGVRFTDFHAAAACSPTRAMLMTGTDHHIAGLGNLIEWTNISGQNDPEGVSTSQDTAPQRGMPGYEGYLNERVATLPEVLRDGGYETLMAGKWHLGLTKERSPKARGFERSFAHLPACSNHYAFEPQLEGQDETPVFMEASFIALHMEDGEYVRKLPDGWYSTIGYGEKMLQYLRDRVDRKETRPFFAYLPFTATHWPLQAPQEDIKKYHGVYDDGPDALRLKRLEGLKKQGLIEPDVEPHPVIAPEVKDWSDMSPQEKALSSRSMEVFAGMVDRIDQVCGMFEIGCPSLLLTNGAKGKVFDYLKETGEFDNTFICFMSDNGAEGAAYEAYPIVKGHMMEHLAKYYNNSLDNLGNFDSFIWYGPRWAQASTAPSRLFKAYTTEGGIRVPMVAKWPSSLQTADQASGITHNFGTVMDLAPTLIEMAGLKHPAPSYQGREIVHMRGKSMLPWVKGAVTATHDQDFINGWETCGRAACRQGDWKIVFIPKPKGPERWQLYNLREDPGEIHDLAEARPEKMQELLKLWDQYVLETGVIPLCPALGEYLEATEAQMPENAWMEFDYWKPGARDAPEDPKFRHYPPRLTRPQRVVKQI